MQTLFRQRPDTFLGFCKGGDKFSHRIADSGAPVQLPATRALERHLMEMHF
jgi:hypothetical protein